MTFISATEPERRGILNKPTTEKKGLIKEIFENLIRLEITGKRKDAKIKIKRADRETRLFLIFAERKIPKEDMTKLNARL